MYVCPFNFNVQWQLKQKPHERLAQRYLSTCVALIDKSTLHSQFINFIAINQVIAAEGEQKASRALREASEVIGDSPAALQLRYLQVTIKLIRYPYSIAMMSRLLKQILFHHIRTHQTLSTISAEKNSTIVFPLPIDLITYFLKSRDSESL